MDCKKHRQIYYEREFDQSPNERRDAIRQDGDLGHIAIR